MKHRRSVPLAAAALLLSLAPSPAAQCEVDKVIGSNVNQKDQFAFSLGMREETVIAGCFKCDEAGGESGAAYLYRWDGYELAEIAVLSAGDGAPFDHLGWDVDVDPTGQLAVAGAPDEDRPGLPSSPGAAYVFFDGPAGWVEYAKLVASDAQDGARFGAAVAALGTTILVGAPGRGGKGGVYVFQRFGPSWFQTQVLEPPGLSAGAQFGSSIDFDGATIAVGAKRQDLPGAAGAGQVWLYTRPGTAWELQDDVVSVDPKPNDAFGHAVVVRGDKLIVGAPDDDDQGFGANSNTGVGFYFERTGTTWSLVHKLLPPATSHGFGYALGLDGTFLVVGANLDKQVGTDAGAGHVFELQGGTWHWRYKMINHDHAALDAVGGAVAFAGDVAVIGTDFDDDVGFNAGAAYAYSVRELNCKPLYAYPPEVSLSAGGHQDWNVDAGAAFAGHVYWVLGSLVPNGSAVVDAAVLPLGLDEYTVLTVQFKNSPTFPGSLGLLDAAGRASAAFVAPPASDPGLAGLSLYHAFVVLDPVTVLGETASNLTRVLLVP